MKTVAVTPDASGMRTLFDEARREDLLLRLDDGTEFFLSVVDDFDREVARPDETLSYWHFWSDVARSRLRNRLPR